MVDVVLDGVSKKFGATTAVKNMNMQVHDGEFVVLLGPTGAGKTTTLRLVAGLEKPDGGSIVIGGQDMTESPPAARDVTFVFQQYSLYPHLSVYDNLAFPLRSPAHRLAEDEIRRRIEDVVRLLRISDKLENRATQLSGGEMQRVAIGRALALAPRYLLLDEPAAGMSDSECDEMVALIGRVPEHYGCGVLLIEHNMRVIMNACAQIHVIDSGRTIAEGTPAEMQEHPDVVRAYLGSKSEARDARR